MFWCWCFRKTRYTDVTVTLSDAYVRIVRHSFVSLSESTTITLIEGDRIMRKSLFMTAVLGLASFGANAQNLLANNSFETPGPGVVLFQNWMQFGNVFADVGVEVTPQDGTTAAKMFGASTGSQSDQVLLQTVSGASIIPGELYTVTSHVLNPSIDAIGSENIILLQMSFKDANGDAIESPETPAIDIENDPFDTWIESSVSGIAPVGTTQITVALLHIQLGADAGFPVQEGGASFWDNISLVQGEAPCNNPADLNGDGAVNFFDVSLFIQLYNQGCD